MAAFSSPPPQFPDALPAGTPLQNGNFSLSSVLGQGGFGITYEGRDEGLQRPVAVKEFFPQGCRRQGSSVAAGAVSASEYAAFKETFLQEARTLAQFSNSSIVDVYTVFEENNSAYMVMELLRGRTLMQLVEERGALMEDEAVALIEAAAQALEAVHGAALLHGDIKPDNLMLCDDGRVVLIDFSLTRQLQTSKGLATARLSQDTRYGTVGYAPLEQYARSSALGAYTDVYALAATLYHLLTGQAPPPATDRAAGLELAPVRALNPRVSEAVAQTVMDGLAMEPPHRPQSAREFAARLRQTWPGQTPPAQINQTPFGQMPPAQVPPSQMPPAQAPAAEPVQIKVSVPDYAPPAPQASPPDFEYQGPVFAPPPVVYEEPPPLYQPPQTRPRLQVRTFGCGPIGCILTIFVLLFLLPILGPVVLVLLPLIQFFFG